MNKEANSKTNPQMNPIPDEVVSQILTVRDTGMTNMFDILSVQRIAYDLELHDLVTFLEERENQKA